MTILYINLLTELGKKITTQNLKKNVICRNQNAAVSSTRAKYRSELSLGQQDMSYMFSLV